MFTALLFVLNFKTFYKENFVINYNLKYLKNKKLLLDIQNIGHTENKNVKSIFCGQSWTNCLLEFLNIEKPN